MVFEQDPVLNGKYNCPSQRAEYRILDLFLISAVPGNFSSVSLVRVCLQQEFHEHRMHLDKLERDASELRAQLQSAMSDNSRLRHVIERHKARCTVDFDD